MLRPPGPRSSDGDASTSSSSSRASRMSPSISCGVPLPAEVAQREPDLERPEAARVLRPALVVVQLLLVEASSTAACSRTRRAGRRRCGRARSRPRPACRATCADRARSSPPRASARRSSGALGARGRERAVGAVDVQPEVLLAAERGELAQRIDGAGDTEPPVADDEEREQAVCAVGRDRVPQRGDVHAQRRVGRDPAQGLGAEPEHVGRLLHPGVGLGRAVHAQPRRRSCPRRARPTAPAPRRAASTPMKFAMFPPLTSSPPQSGR